MEHDFFQEKRPSHRTSLIEDWDFAVEPDGSGLKQKKREGSLSSGSSW